MNEQAIIEPRERFVDKAMSVTEQMIDRDLLGPMKVKFREPHIMGDEEIDELLERLSEAIYDGVGKKRTSKFDMARFMPLYPSKRYHFDFKEMIEAKDFDHLID